MGGVSRTASGSYTKVGVFSSARAYRVTGLHCRPLKSSILAPFFASPQTERLPRFGHVNYEDPYFSVGLPIFSIHGNHDDPTREGGVEALAALDLLHVANLVNYFGKSDKVRDASLCM